MLRAYGAELQLTPGSEGMQGAINLARELVDEIPGSYLLQQFDNPANPAVAQSGEEIWSDTDGSLDALVAVGTGGTITGCARVLRERQPNLVGGGGRAAASPVLGWIRRPHRIQGSLDLFPC